MPLVIHTALDKFDTHEWLGIFTNSLSSLKAIQHCYTNPRTRGPQHYYHHHLLLLSRITDLLEEKRRQGYRTTLPKTRAHTNTQGNNLVDAAAKMAVT